MDAKKKEIPGPHRVYIGLVPTGYLNAELINKTVREGFAFCASPQALEKLPHPSQILLVADVPAANRKIAPYAYTHPEVVHAVLTQTLGFAPSSKISVTAKAALGLPSFRALKNATGGSESFKGRGYFEFEGYFPGKVKVLPGDEAQHSRYQLSKGEILRNRQSPTLANPQTRYSNESVALSAYAESDFVIFCPKLKTSVLSDGLNGALTFQEPMLEPCILRNQRICDQLEICHPDLIVTDGIISAAGGNYLTQKGHELGVILVSNNAVAHDWVSSLIFNLDPSKIGYLQTAIQRGWGPSHFSRIELGGNGIDALKQLSQKTRFWDLGLISINKFGEKFEKENPELRFPIQIYDHVVNQSEANYGPHLLNWLYRIYDFQPLRSKMAAWSKATVCMGNFENSEIAKLPDQLIYVFGEQALKSFERYTSHSRCLLSIHQTEVKWIQFKNGSRRFVITSPTSNFTLAFTIGSLGRMTRSFLYMPFLVDRLLFSFRTWWKQSYSEVPPKAVAQDRAITSRPTILTSRLAHNGWWSLGVKRDSHLR